MLALGPLSAAQVQTEAHSGPLAARPPDVLRLALQWSPQSQFAGIYMAQRKGLYADAGLRIELIHANAERSSLDLLHGDDADVATAFLADAIVAAAPPATSQAEAMDLVQIAQLVQHSNLMLLAWKDLGIQGPEDLDGQMLSHWQGAFSASFDVFFAAYDVEPVVIPQYYSVNLFLKRGVAACAAMQYNEYHRIWQAGVDDERLTGFLMRDYGLGFPEDGLYTKSDWLDRHGELARALRRATLAGWEYARAHPEETLDVVLAEAAAAGIPANRPHERWMLEHILASILGTGNAPEPPGALNPTVYTQTVDTLVAAGLIGLAPDFSTFAPLDARTQ
ncbi:ABC transporter substrate-binding protein [Thiohalocapsa marina]|uniref:ABC transporter substrate-binding protein n=1 Tax=Thiohalocapsa marina TaxID=424902 RepID=UPI0036DBB272